MMSLARSFLCIVQGVAALKQLVERSNIVGQDRVVPQFTMKCRKIAPARRPRPGPTQRLGFSAERADHFGLHGGRGFGQSGEQRVARLGVAELVEAFARGVLFGAAGFGGGIGQSRSDCRVAQSGGGWQRVYGFCG